MPKRGRALYGALTRTRLRASLARRARSLHTYLICSTHRTGSTLLCQLLTDTGICGVPDEYWSPRWAPRFAERLAGTRAATDDGPPSRSFDRLDFGRYLHDLFEQRATPNRWWGCKLQWTHVRRVHEVLEPLRGDDGGERTLRLLRQIYADPRYVWVRRRDKVRQAISFWRSKQTKVFTSTGPVEESERPSYDYERIDGYVRRFERQDAEWQRFFETHGVEPFRIEFETFVKEPGPTIEELIAYLGIERPAGLELPAPRLKKISDGLNDEWCERYHRERGELR